MSKFTIKKWLTKKAKIFGVVAASVAVLGTAAAVLSTNSVKAQSNCDPADYVISCGVTSADNLRTDYVNNTQGIDAIYQSSPFGISTSDIYNLAANLGTGPTNGYVTINGDVYLNGDSTPVATGAVTAGRQEFFKSTCNGSNQTNNGIVWVRDMRCAFYPGQTQLAAYVDMQNGIFVFAAFSSCANPVHAVPVIPPATLTCNTLTLNAGKPELNGDTPYTLTATASAKNATIENYYFIFNVGGPLSENQTLDTHADTATSETHIYYPGSHTAQVNVNGTTDDGKAISDNCVKSFTVPPAPTMTCDSLTATPITKPGVNGNIGYQFVAQATATSPAQIVRYDITYDQGTAPVSYNSNASELTVTHTYGPGTHYASVTVYMTADGQTVPVTSEACNTKIVTPPAPEYQCTDLALTPVKNEVRTVQEVTTYSAANGAKYKSVTINWGDGSAPQTYVNPTETHQYANYGTYVVNVVDVNFTLPNGQVVTNTEPSCQKKSITFSHPSTPSYACVSLSVSPQNPTSLTTPIQGVATYSMTSGVTFVNVSYDWGDGQTDVVTTNSATDQTTASHTYSNYGTYTITATANFEVNGQPVSVSSDNCQTQINIPAPTCTVPGETNLPANSPECVPPTTPSGPLPNTGPGNVVAIFGGTTLLGTIGHFLYRRRFSHKAL